MSLFRKTYIVRVGTLSLAIPHKYAIVKAISRKSAYKKVRKVLSRGQLVISITRLKNVKNEVSREGGKQSE